jgi:hypothetical protein
VSTEVHGVFVELWNLREDELPLKPGRPKSVGYKVGYVATRITTNNNKAMSMSESIVKFMIHSCR